MHRSHQSVAGADSRQAVLCSTIWRATRELSRRFPERALSDSSLTAFG